MMITPHQALDVVLTHVCPLESETVRLSEASGRYLAEAVCADRPMPPTHRSAMDGYALRAADAAAGHGAVTLIGECAVGQDNASVRIKPGQCMRIFTGAVIPPGADAVVKVEDTERQNDTVLITAPHVRTGDNIRKKGEEYNTGKRLLSAGTLLGGCEIALCASAGASAVRVYRRPRISILCSGNELVPPEQTALPCQLRDSNGPALDALVRRAGGRVIQRRRIKDRPALVERALRAALEHSDIIISSGGVSVGQYDYIPAAVEAVGAAIRFHNVSVKPGKPVLYATHHKNVQIFGLPGNPLGTLNSFFEFVRPALSRMQGAAVRECLQTAYFPLSKTLLPKGNRVEYVPVKVVHRPSGAVLEPIECRSSADILAVTAADGMAILPRRPEQCRAGCVVAFRSWRPLW